MYVELLHYTPLNIAVKAIRNCWQSTAKSDSNCYEIGEKDKELLRKIIYQNQHTSTIEHIHYNFFIAGISRGCLQELARHRLASFSVKSTRYTLRELKNAEDLSKFLVLTGDEVIDDANWGQLEYIRTLLRTASAIPNDKLKYLLPEAYKTELYFSINARSLRNLLSLRLSNRAHFEIKELAEKLLKSIPEVHSILYEDFLCDLK